MLSVGIAVAMLSGSNAAVQENAKPEAAPQTLVVVVGAPGTEAFGTSFREWADRWVAAGKAGGANVVRIDGSGTKPSREILQTTLQSTSPNSRLWMVLIGHGTFDQRTARFNLVGPDVSADELSEWIHKDQPAAIINCASSSAPFINQLSGKNRVVVTATKSGAEQNYARFGQFMSEVIGDKTVDLDKDGQTSLLEAWLIAARRTQDFYSENGRLATEHALIDDNGDERGTRYDAFVGIRPVRKTKNEQLDGLRANQWHLVRGEFERAMPAKLIAERDELEMAVLKLRENRSEYREDDYYQELESLLVPLAVLYAEAERAAK
ncbi:MAG: hypothetical protein AB8G99_15930 [Planctomycetaceae bacterium]